MNPANHTTQISNPMGTLTRACLASALSLAFSAQAAPISMASFDMPAMTFSVTDLNPGDGLSAGYRFRDVEMYGIVDYNNASNRQNNFDSFSVSAQVPAGLNTRGTVMHAGGPQSAFTTLALAGDPEISIAAYFGRSSVLEIDPMTELQMTASYTANLQIGGADRSPSARQDWGAGIAYNFCNSTPFVWPSGGCSPFERRFFAIDMPGEILSASFADSFTWTFRNPSTDVWYWYLYETLSVGAAIPDVITQVSEPGTIFLLGIGVLGLAGLTHLTKRRSTPNEHDALPA